MILIGRGLDPKTMRKVTGARCWKAGCAVFRVRTLDNSGGDSERDPPVPIPNTEVKPFSADGTWLETARESRTLPDSTRNLANAGFFFYVRPQVKVFT